MEKENLSKLWTIGYDTILELETAEGILASGKEEIYGCIFGRDTLITSLKLLKVYEKTKNEYFLTLVKKVLQNLALLQGTKVNIESGEEPGKCIHEFRPTNHEHLTKNLLTPWYVYDDNIMRNYDTVDATPLFLVAMYEYYKVSGDEEFLQRNLGSVANGLHWIKTYGDSNGDGFIDYTFHKDRKFGGLHTQSWMDSSESVFHEDGTEAVYPVAPVEVQAYTYAALRAWSDFFPDEDLSTMAANLKKEFNQKFVLTPHDDSSDFEIAFAIDGNGKALSSARSSMGHTLWPTYTTESGKETCILDEKYIPKLVNRLLQPDLFEAHAGIRTLSTKSKNFRPNSYHNGSIWPHDTAIIIAGLENFGYFEEAGKIRTALLSAYSFFQTPIELFVYSEGILQEYCSDTGQKACKKQAWSAASMLSNLSFLLSDYKAGNLQESFIVKI